MSDLEELREKGVCVVEKGRPSSVWESRWSCIEQEGMGCGVLYERLSCKPHPLAGDSRDICGLCSGSEGAGLSGTRSQSSAASCCAPNPTFWHGHTESRQALLTTRVCVTVSLSYSESVAS